MGVWRRTCERLAYPSRADDFACWQPQTRASKDGLHAETVWRDQKVQQGQNHSHIQVQAWSCIRDITVDSPTQCDSRSSQSVQLSE